MGPAEVAVEAVTGAIRSVGMLAMIIIPIMLVIEILKDTNFFGRLSGLFHPLVRFLGVSREGAFPLLVGMVIGISYGSGILIEAARENSLSRQERYVISTFLSVCHAVFEDTMLFVAIGASASLLLGVRILLAVLFALAVGTILRRWSLAPGKRLSGRSQL